MTSSQALAKVAELTISLGPGASGSHVLSVKDKELRITPGQKPPPDAKRITTLTARDINVGMTSGKWNSVQHQLQHAIKKGLL